MKQDPLGSLVDGDDNHEELARIALKQARCWLHRNLVAPADEHGQQGAP